MQYIIRGDTMKYLTSALSYVLDFINKFSATISEKFTGEDSSAILIMVAFYLIVLILLLLLLKGIVNITKDLLRTIFSRHEKKKVRAVSPNNANSVKEDIQPTTNTVNGDSVNNKKRTKNIDELSLIKGFGNKKYMDNLSRILEKITEFDNCAIQSQHISTKIPLSPVTKEDNFVLSEEAKEKIKEQVEDKNLKELKILLQQVNKEELKFDNAIRTLEISLSKVMKKREKVVHQETTAIGEYNSAVDALATLCNELSKSKSDLLEKHSELFNFIVSLGDQKVVLLDSIKEFIKDISKVQRKIEDFASQSNKEYKSFVSSFQKNEERLAGFKKNYTVLSESRNQIDKEISTIQQEQSKVGTDKAFNIELASVLRAKIHELEELEREHLAIEEAERLEKERLAKEEAERLERERQEKLEAEKLEKERLAKEEAERVERERLAKLETERLEKERLVKEQAEQLERDRVAKEEAEKIVKDTVDSDKELQEIKEQIKRQQQNSYSINYDDISPEMLEKMAIAEQKKRKAAEKAAKQNGKSFNKPENTTAENYSSESKSDRTHDDMSVETEDKAAQNVSALQEEPVPQTDHFTILKQQWAEEEANKRRWAEEKARREEEHQRKKKELAAKLSGNGTSEND